jgi:hypothetical protein
VKDEFLESYGGQSTEELIALDSRYRTDSIVLAFEQAIQQAGEKRALSREETYVLAVEGLEREVNNGGYSQFFINSSNEYAGSIVSALRAIGCPKTADMTQQAIAALGIQGELTREAMEAVILSENDAVKQRLAACDDRYFANDEPIADRLFDWIKSNRAQIRVGG